MNPDPFCPPSPAWGRANPGNSSSLWGGAIIPDKEWGSLRSFLPLLTHSEGNSEFILSEFTKSGENVLTVGGSELKIACITLVKISEQSLE